MKQGAIVNRIVMILFFLAILLYFGGSALRSFHDPYPTTPCYAYSTDDTVEATGYLVRRESVLTGQGGIVQVLPDEGEKVAVGETVAKVYQDEGAVERSNQLEALQLEADQLSYAISQSGQADQGAKLGENVIDAMVELRSSAEAGDFTDLESQSLAFKSAVYQQADRYGDAADLSAALTAVQGRIDALSAQAPQSTSRVTVSESGVFSRVVDGYESRLTPEVLEGLTPAALDALAGGGGADAAALGKLITSTTWYFVCPISETDAARLTEGEKVTARFSRDWSGDVEMTVERIGAPEDGRVAVVFSSSRFLSETTLLRRQTVDLVFATMTGVRVPAAAVRMDENGTTGVYVRVGSKAEFKPVEVLDQGEDYYLVTPVEIEDATLRQERKALRAGDDVIVATQEIYDGKIVE